MEAENRARQRAEEEERRRREHEEDMLRRQEEAARKERERAGLSKLWFLFISPRSQRKHVVAPRPKQKHAAGLLSSVVGTSKMSWRGFDAKRSDWRKRARRRPASAHRHCPRSMSCS
jgi:hypothetical protein